MQVIGFQQDKIRRSESMLNQFGGRLALVFIEAPDAQIDAFAAMMLRVNRVSAVGKGGDTELIGAHLGEDLVGNPDRDQDFRADPLRADPVF